MQNSTCINSGIDIVGHVSWGTHFCKFYETEEDLWSVIVPYFQVGLTNNECCIWVSSSVAEAEALTKKLLEKIPSFTIFVQKNQIQIFERSMLPEFNGENAKEIIDAFIEMEDQQLAAGYSGLRLAGVAVSSQSGEKWKNFVCYENIVNNLMYGRKIIALCCYSLNDCGAYAVLDIVKNHEFALAIREKKWELIENATTKILKNKLQKNNLELENKIYDRTKKLEDALQARDRFFSLISHELKTPLTSIRLYLDAMLYQNSFAGFSDEKKVLKKIQEQSLNLEKLLNNLLDVAVHKKEGNFLVNINQEQINLSSLVRTAIDRFSGDIENAKCPISLNLDESVIGWWDSIRIDQVVGNLLSNALKYASGAAITIIVSREKDHAKLSIHDHGPGISPEDQLNVFDLFVQGSKKNWDRSLGIGLWLVKKIVEIHQGSITLRDNIPTGCCFDIKFPLKPMPESLPSILI